MSTVLHYSVSGLSLSPADGVPPMVGGGPGAGGARQGRQGAVDGPTDARIYNWFIGLGEGASACYCPTVQCTRVGLRPADGAPMAGGGLGAGGARQGRRGAVDGPTDARMYNRFIGVQCTRTPDRAGRQTAPLLAPMASGGLERGGAKQVKRGAADNPKDARMYDWVSG